MFWDDDKHPFLEFDSQEQKEKLIFLDDQRLLQRVVRSNLGTYFFFRGKFTSVCGKNSLGFKKSPENTPHMHRKKILEYLRLFAEVPRLTTSIWWKIRQNTVCLHRSEHKSKMKRAILLVRRLWLNNSE